jgi:hypothetical protein
MSIVIHNVEQGSPEWLKVRAGIPTASEFSSIIDRKKNGDYTAARQQYLYTLAGERITGEVVSGYSGGHLERGRAMEDDARRLYEFDRDVQVERVGFVTNSLWNAGASPDSFVGKDGAIEIKTKLPHLHIACLETDEVPEDHIAQCQGVLAISGRAWIDFISYWPRLPIFVKRLHRDEPYIAKMKTEVLDFNAALAALAAKYSFLREAA